jgi:hypothetical protein
MPSGPFAILPLKNNRSSLVWTERTADADRLVAADDLIFEEELERRFGHKLGSLKVVGSKRAFPLGLTLARAFVAPKEEPAVYTGAGRWLLAEGYLKPYAGVRHTHYGAAAALRLHPSVGYRLEAVRSIKLVTYGEAIQYCGGRSPRTSIAAQFSLSWACAAAMFVTVGAATPLLVLASARTILVTVDCAV